MLPTHTFTFSCPIWRLLFDSIPTPETQSLLAIELRDKSTVEWAVIEVESGEIYWQKTFPEVDWWTSIIGFYAGVLLFHSYAGSEQPAPKRLWAVDAQTGLFLWEIEGHVFTATDGQIIETSPVHLEVSLQTTNRYLRTGQASSLALSTEPLAKPTWQFPITHNESSPYYSVIERFLQKFVGKIAQKPLNYGEIAGHILFFQYLYHANATALSRSILVVNTSKTILHHETLETDVTSIALGESFYNEHHLVYLKNLQELVVIKLPKP